MAGPAYKCYVNRVQRNERRAREEGDDDVVEDPWEGQYSVDTGECVDLIEYKDKQGSLLPSPTRSEMKFRRAVSASVFIMIIALQGVINYYAESLLTGIGDTTTSTIMALVVKLVNAIWKKVCRYLTKYERHKFWSDFRRWDCLKVFTFKICNVTVLYFVKRNAILQDDSGVCALRAMASQFFMLVVMDITVNAVMEVLVPWYFARQAEAKAIKDNQSADDDLKPGFDLADEYTEVAYRQYVVGVGIFVCPFLPVLSLIATALEFWLDRYRLLRICRKPKKIQTTFKNVLLFFYFLMSIFVLVGYPNGAVWILNGSAGLADNELCFIYQ
jgi:hypothetical protein